MTFWRQAFLPLPARMLHLPGAALACLVACGACASIRTQENADATAQSQGQSPDKTNPGAADAAIPGAADAAIPGAAATGALVSDSGPERSDSETRSGPDAGPLSDAQRHWQVVTELTPGQAGHIAEFDVAARNNLGVVGYREYRSSATGVVSTAVMLQRFDAQGARLGDTVSLAMSEGDTVPLDAVTVATDGTDCVICWQQEVDVACVPMRGDAAITRGIRYFKGASPKLIHTGDNWVLAYLTEDNSRILVEALDADLNRIGVVLDLPSTGAPATRPVMSAADGHLSLLAGAPDPNDSNAHLYRMNSTLDLEHPVVSLDKPHWLSASVASLGDHSLVSLASAYTGFLIWVDAAGQLSELEIAGGGKAGNSHQIQVIDDRFFVAWYVTASHITTEFVDGPPSGRRDKVEYILPALRMIDLNGKPYGVSLREHDPQVGAYTADSRQAIAIAPLE